jgi:NADPH-dependent 2,4-dienoyl-CoA reductase/sulfur reductase-like enzyme
MFGAWISSARGDNRVRGATVRSGDNLLELQCDILCAGYGLVPSTEVALLAGCMLRNDAVMVDENQCTSVDAMYAVGEATGVKGADAAIREGQLAGVSIADKPADAPRKTALRREIAKERAFAGRMDVAFRLREELQHVTTRDTIVCRCEDVGLGEIVRCGSMREAKLHTRAGMGPCQGRVCGPAMEFIMGWNETSVRPPVVPAPLSAFITDGAQ